MTMSPMTTAPDQTSALPLALARLRDYDFTPSLGLILGSGLGPLADELEVVASLPFESVPGFARSTAPGHSGELVLGTLEGQKLIAMKGRVHYYEGVSAQTVAFPVRLMAALGAHTLIVSNACGGLNPNWRAGELMLQLDFINFTFDNPLIGPNDALGPRFPVMFDPYDPDLQSLARRVARREDILLREGVYLAISGPSYATRAELRLFRRWGADAIGMSTVYEVMVARHQGMRVLGLSSVTDMAIADRDEHASGEDVLASAARSGPTFRRLVKAILAEL
ncbi:MAG: purine-nucleoside phosphorylase [Deinococcota bacterium]|nr:purine-nucleoside phosphorylase [Deinococcota bacterium]